MLGFLFVVLWTEFHCVIQASLTLHPQALILLHTDTSYHPYKAGTDHMQVTYQSHLGHNRVCLVCAETEESPALLQKSWWMQITHGNTNKLWKASLLAGPRSAAACEPESLGPSAPLLPSLALL